MASENTSDSSETGESLRQSEKRYRALYESLRDAFVQVSMDGYIVDCNDLYCQMLGYSADELRCVTYVDLTPERWHEFEESIVKEQVLPQGYSEVYEKEYRRKDGTIFPVELRTILVRDDYGRPEMMWALVRDISDRRQREEQLQMAADALHRSNEELQHFAYAVSHDLRSPLRNVMACSELLQRRLEPALDGPARELLQFICSGAQRMRELIDGLLSYSLADKGEWIGRSVNLEDVISVAVENTRQAAIQTGAVITWDGLPLVRGDFGRLVQVMQNLIVNAIQYRGSDPPRIVVSSQKGQDEWIISVMDNGMGIASEHHDRIFGLLQRVSLSNGTPGTGIGLATCKRIIERHGGRIWVESEPGRGAAFHFTLPSVEEH